MKPTFHNIYEAAIFFPKAARGHGSRHHSYRDCVEPNCQAHKHRGGVPHEAHVKRDATPFGLALEGREANAFLHITGER